MNTAKLFLLTGLLTMGVSCNKQGASRKTSSISDVKAAEFLKAEPFIVRIQDEQSSKVMSLSLKYSGQKGLKKSLEGQTDVVQNLVISILSNYDLKKLNTHKGKQGFQNNILTSLNEFVAGNKFIKVDIVELKEI